MGSTETLHLRWNEYETNIKNGFSVIRVDEDFFDVTLACGENQIKAHKVILSTCSSFFKSLLKSVPHQHPLLYLGGIDFHHLESVLAFMYNGEVKVKPDELDHFLAVAQELKINGLMHNESKSDEPFVKSEHFKKDAPSKELKRLSSSESSVPNKKIEHSIVKEEEMEEIIPAESNSYVESGAHFEYANDRNAYEVEIEDANTDQDKQSQLNELLDARLSEFISSRDANKKFRCLKCSYSSTVKAHVKKHVEARHFETDGFTCDKCGGRYKTRNSLREHKRIIHKKDMEFFSTNI